MSMLAKLEKAAARGLGVFEFGTSSNGNADGGTLEKELGDGDGYRKKWRKLRWRKRKGKSQRHMAEKLSKSFEDGIGKEEDGNKEASSLGQKSAALLDATNIDDGGMSSEEDEELMDYVDAEEALLHEDAHPDGGLACMDKSLLSRQRRAIVEVMKSLAKNLLTGQLDLLKVSLPVKLFEPRSYLQKLADPWVYPQFLKKAAMASNPVLRMQWTVTYIIAGYHRAFLNWAKPFNPILGETWQASLSDGTRVFMEQISHHPPLSSFEMIGPEEIWNFHGLSQPCVSYKSNAIKTSAKGHRRIGFHDGSCIEVTYPHYNIKGLLYSDSPRAEITGIAEFMDKENGLLAILHFGGSQYTTSNELLRRSDAVFGSLYSISHPDNKTYDSKLSSGLNSNLEYSIEANPTNMVGRFRMSRKNDNSAPDFSKRAPSSESLSTVTVHTGKSYDAVGEIQMMATDAGKTLVSTLRGNWLSYVDWDDQRFWTLAEDEPLEWHDDVRPLPSDSRYREDLQALVAGDIEAAQTAKSMLEDQQRADAKARKAGSSAFGK